MGSVQDRMFRVGQALTTPMPSQTGDEAIEVGS